MLQKKCSIAIHTLGCKLNQAESEALARDLSQHSYNIVSGFSADMFILNTCSVTHIADRKSRHMVRMLRKKNPSSLIAVTGCYAERVERDLADCGADIIIGNHDKMSLPAMLEGKLKALPFCADSPLPGEKLERVRCFIKIQDGCGNLCSYCIVPFVRREIYSVDVDTVVAEINARVKDGYKEAVLTGTEVGLYNSGGYGLKDLLDQVLKETTIERLHLSSLQPGEMTADLLALWQNPRMLRHFHIALQSGSNTVLKRMGRRYDTGLYQKAVDMVRAFIADASITTDVMVGFPGEGAGEFEESYAFCQKMKFAALHVFSYSPRPGTRAAKMPGKVSGKVKKERSLKMLELAARSAEEFGGRFTGQTRYVLWENKVKPRSGVYAGFTDNYIRTYTESGGDLANSITRVKLLAPANQITPPVSKASTRGNYGELWGELTA